MRVQRSQKKQSPLLWVIPLLVVLAGSSYFAAYVWQNVEDTAIAAETARPPGDAAASQQPSTSELSIKAEPLTEQSSGSVSSSSEAPPVSKASQPEVSGEMPLREAFKDAVKESPRVTNAYFDDAIFFGDSISTGIPLYQVMKNASVVAFTGINTHSINTKEVIDTPNGRVTMLEAAKQYGNKKKVYIMLGANGIDFDKPTFIEGYRQFVLSVKAQYPGAVIYLQSMTPVTKDCYLTYPSVNNEKLEEYNISIMALSNELKVYYVDVAQALMDENGELPKEASVDGMHMSAEYYTKWFDYLKTHTVEEK